jgi:hypothetical protein
VVEEQKKEERKEVPFYDPPKKEKTSFSQEGMVL